MGSALTQLTVDEKVLLHLSQFIFDPDDREAPLEATQDGIAEAAGINATHVPRSVQNLKKKDLVVEHKLQVAGSDRRRKAYRPTEEGYRRAHEIKDRLLDAEVVVVDDTGTVRRTTLRDLHGSNVSTAQVLTSALAAAPVPLLDLSSGRITPSPSPLSASLYNKVPQVSDFVGRKKELKRLTGALKDPQVRLVVVTGIAGIGKTTLVAKALEKVRRVPTFWYRLHEWETLRNLGFVMAEFLSRLDRNGLKAYMEGQLEHDVATAYEIVQKDLEGVEAVVVLDDFDKAPRSFLGLIRSFLPHLDRFTGITFVVVTRAAIPFFSQTDRVEGRVAEIVVEGLPEEDARRLVPSRLDKGRAAEVCRMTEGHPLLLKLFGTAEESGPEEDVEGGFVHSEGVHRFLTEEILSSLSQSERRALEAASVHRAPIPPEVLFVDTEVDHDVIDALRRRLLLRSVGGRFIELVDFVREFVYQRMRPEARREAHLAASRAVEDAGMPWSGWMVAQHLLAAGEAEQAADVLLSRADRYLEAGKTEELASVLRDLDGASGVSEGTRRRLAGLRAVVYERAGDARRAAEWRRRAGGEAADPTLEDGAAVRHDRA